MSARTILNPPLINELNDLFNGTGTSDITASTITATEFIVDGNSSTVTPTITTNVSSNIVLSTAAASGMTLSSPSGNATFTPGASGVSVNSGITASTFTTSVAGTSTFDNVETTGTITCGSGITASSFISSLAGTSSFDDVETAGSITCGSGITASTFTTSVAGTSTFNAVEATGTITCDSGITASTFTTSVAGTSTFDNVSIAGNITALSYSGGIAAASVQGAAPGTIAALGGYVFPNVEILDFIGSATSAYIVSNNTAPTTPYLPFTFTVAFVSTSGGNTYVDVGVVNCSSTTSYNAVIDFSIIAMN